MDLVEDLAEPTVPVTAACASLAVSRATLYRATCPPPPPTVRQAAPNPRRLGDTERQAILDVMHSEEFVDQPPLEVFAKLLSRGVYLASIRTIYRVLAELGESKERRNQRLPHPYVKPSLTATAPNQVWTWDISVPQISGVKDEGRSLAIGLQEQIANHRKRLGSKALVVSVAEKVP